MNLRVAFLSWRDTSHPDGGGSEVYVEALAAELVRRGHSVTILAARYPGASSSEWRDGVRLRRLGGRLTVYLWGLAWAARHRKDIDVVVDVINGLPFATPLVRRHGIVALVHHLHAEQWRIIYPGWPGAVGWFIESRIMPRLYRGRQFLTVSRASAEDLVAQGVSGGAITVVRNGLVAAPPSTEARSTQPRLCVLARLVPHKRIDHAFEVVARLSAEFPDLHLDVIGDGWWREELVREAETRGVSQRVTFHGHVSADERDDVLARAWLQLTPSVKEGWCLAVSEAGAQGTPSVAYASAGGVRESISDHVTGLLVADLEELVDATGSLLRDPTRRRTMGSAARRDAAGLTWTASADAAERVLRGVATRRR